MLRCIVARALMALAVAVFCQTGSATPSRAAGVELDPAPVLALTKDMSPVQITRVDMLVDSASTPPGSDAPWTVAELPDAWEQSHPGLGGTVWYRFTVRFNGPPAGPWALMLPRVSMNADLWVNNVLTGRRGRMDESLTRHWNTPLLFPIPDSVWIAGGNVVHVRVQAAVEQHGGLGRMLIGPVDAVVERHGERAFWQNTLVSAANAFVVALGLFFLFVWLQKRELAHYGYFAVATILWGLSNTDMTVQDPPIPDAAWIWLIVVMRLWAMMLLTLFCVRFTEQRMPRLEAGALAFSLLATLLLAIALMNGRHVSATHTALMLPVLAMGTWAVLMLMRRMVTHPKRDSLLLAPAAVATVAAGMHDWLITAGQLPFGHVYALPYVAPVLVSTLGWMIAGEYACARREVEALNRDLAELVRVREAQLRDTFDSLARSDRALAVAAERARILRDMHDGVGSHLTSAMRQLENGRASTGHVLQTLRESLSQLKLSIDVMNLPVGDVNALLASLRYRLQPRIDASGVTLHWDVGPLPLWPSGTHDAMRHLQFLLLEALSNVLQHSHATAVTLAARGRAGGIELSLSDNGRGMTDQEGNGLRSMRARAGALSARLSVLTLLPGTRIEILLPLSQD